MAKIKLKGTALSQSTSGQVSKSTKNISKDKLHVKKKVKLEDVNTPFLNLIKDQCAALFKRDMVPGYFVVEELVYDAIVRELFLVQEGMYGLRKWFTSVATAGLHEPFTINCTWGPLIIQIGNVRKGEVKVYARERIADDIKKIGE